MISPTIRVADPESVRPNDRHDMASSATGSLPRNTSPLMRRLAMMSPTIPVVHTESVRPNDRRDMVSSAIGSLLRSTSPLTCRVTMTSAPIRVVPTESLRPDNRHDMVSSTHNRDHQAALTPAQPNGFPLRNTSPRMCHVTMTSAAIRVAHTESVRPDERDDVVSSANGSPLGNRSP